MSEGQGTFVWYELSTTDVEGAIAFYRNVIGWGVEAWQGALPYTRWTAGGNGVGGVRALDDEARKAGAPPSWLAYVGADDVDALTRKAVGLGAMACVPPTDIPEVGRFSLVRDPQGAALALFRAAGPAMPRPADMTPGYVTWHELLADDWEAELRFYAALFGWQKIEAIDMGAMGTYQIYGKGGRPFGGMMNRPPGYPAPPHWLYYVWVDDLDAAIARVKENGGQVWNGPMEVPGGIRIAQCADPQGAMFAINGK
jgi:predicted enzyme related to lactoylglutathione lyase